MQPPAPPPPPPGLPPPIVYVYPAPPPRQSYLALWIVLGVVGGIFVLGVFAAIAIPQFMSYQGKARRSEAEIHLDAIKKAARAYAVDLEGFPQGDAGPTPAAPCCEHGSNRKCAVDVSSWDHPVWQELDFYVDEPHYFQYTYRGTATELTATAIGDLDCDGTPVVYTLEGTYGDGGPSFTLTRPDRAD